jgi:hypothetical protein
MIAFAFGFLVFSLAFWLNCAMISWFFRPPRSRR